MIALMGGNRGTMTYSILTTRTRLMRRETAIVGDITWEQRQAHTEGPCQDLVRDLVRWQTVSTVDVHHLCYRGTYMYMSPETPYEAWANGVIIIMMV